MFAEQFTRYYKRDDGFTFFAHGTASEHAEYAQRANVIDENTYNEASLPQESKVEK